MSLVRVVTRPDGSVAVIHPNEKLRQPDETDEAFIVRVGSSIAAKSPETDGLPFVDIDKADLPSDRSARNKWRLTTRAGRQVVEPDLELPDPPHPRQNLIDRVRASNSVPELRAQVESLIRGES